VSKAYIKERELYQRVHLHPFVDLRDIDVVQVLTPGSGSGVGQRAQVVP